MRLTRTCGSLWAPGGLRGLSRVVPTAHNLNAHAHRRIKTWSAGAASEGSPYVRHLLDSAILEHVGIYGNPYLSAGQAVQTDPNLVLGHVLRAGLSLFSTGQPYSSPDITGPLRDARKALETKGGSEVEKAHVDALDKWVAKESMGEAVSVWEDILTRHPRDELAVKFAHDAYFFLGKAPEMKKSIDQVLGEWERSSDETLFGYLMGMSAFGLEENLMYDQAEKRAYSALALNPRDTWAIHALAHVYEMRGKQEEGIRFLTEQMANWKWCTGLACHLWWHMALHYIEQGKHHQALAIYDNHMAPMMESSGAMLDLVDAASLLQRIEFDDGSVGDRWQKVRVAFAAHQDDRVLAYNDVHLAVTLLGSGETSEYTSVLGSLHDQAQAGKRPAQLGEPLARAFAAYRAHDYERATDLLMPLIKSNAESVPLVSSFIELGGSNAQRDLFAQLFLLSLGKSRPQDEAKKQLLDVLLFKRSEASDRSSPLTHRMIDRLLIAPFAPKDDDALPRRHKQLQ